MAAHWPGASGPFAKPMNEIPKVVFPDSLAPADWGETSGKRGLGDSGGHLPPLEMARSSCHSELVGRGIPRWGATPAAGWRRPT